MTKTLQREVHDYISDISKRADIRAGSPLPLGTLERGAASRARLELFDHPEDAAPTPLVDLDSVRNRTGDVRHVWVEGIGPADMFTRGRTLTQFPSHGPAKKVEAIESGNETH